MNIYAELALVAVVVVFIVDLSGFTGSWRGFLARVLGVRELRPLRPFDCSLCMTWWCCLGWAALRGSLSLPTVAASALLAFLSGPLGQIMVLINEWLTHLIEAAWPHKTTSK